MPVGYAVDANGAMTSDGLRTFDYDASNRMTKVKVYKDGEAASIRYLHNQMGQRVFKGEPTAEQTLPDETALGTSFIDWLKKNFSWLYAAAQANTSIGTAYVYGGDNEIPAWALLGEYDNGSSKGAGRTEYIWLPTEDGSAIPIGLYRGGQFYALHTDHLGTPRLMTNEVNKPVWQWPYSAFGSNKPTGILKATVNPKAAITNRPVLLQATAAPEMNLGFPGQMRDVETGAFYNALRDAYDANTGRYRQSDPIGLAGGLNRYNYVEGNAFSLTDPMGLAPTKAMIWLVRICKTGIEKIRPVNFDEAVRLAKKGDADLLSSRANSKKIGEAASKDGRPVTKDEVHPDPRTGSTEGRRKHYHPNPRTGSHIFYGFATAVTMRGLVDCEDCAMGYVAEAVDFFNPLSLPKDLMDLTGVGAPE